MQNICAQCSTKFEITKEDLDFYEKVSPEFDGKKYLIPAPMECYDCRQQRRLAMRNERKLYSRACDLCKKNIISIYSPDKANTVFCPACWWGDSWDALSYGRPFDFNRPFFDQFMDLWRVVPKISSLTLGDNINSDYSHDGYRLKNCYLIFDGEQAEDCYYGELYGLIRDCCDFLYLKECELCYECIHCNKCFDLRYSRYCNNCSSSSFLLDCNSCTNCIGCANLVQKEYCIFNQQYSKQDFERMKAELKLDTASGIEKLRQKADKFFLTLPKRATRGFMNEDVSGDNLTNCKNTLNSFDCMAMRDCRFCTNCMMGCTDCYDVDAWGTETALAYNCAYIGVGAQMLLGCFYTAFNVHDMYYCIFCLQGGHHSFGCEGLRKKGYCILNKEYTKEEYEELVPRIIEHMRKDDGGAMNRTNGVSSGSWGQFFPIGTSPFAYNETVAQDYYPLTKEEIIARGWSWKEPDNRIMDVAKTIDAGQLPDSIGDTSDDVLNRAIRCEVSGRPFKIQKTELSYYRKMGLPLPHRHFEVRHAARLGIRPPRKLWKRTCAKCLKEIQTTYQPSRPEIIYCETCYLSSIY